MSGNELNTILPILVGMEGFSFNSPVLFYWLALLIFICFSAFFAASEIALFSLSKVQRLSYEQRGGFIHQIISWLYDRRVRVLNTILLGNNFVNIGASLSGGAIAQHYFQGNSVLAFIFGALGVTIIIIFFGEVIPKSMSVEKGERIIHITAPLLSGIVFILTPILTIITEISNLILKLMGIKPFHGEEFISDEEMKILVSHGALRPSVEKSEMDMIGGVLDFSESTVDEIMTPRTDLAAFPENIIEEELITVLKHCPYSRVLIYRNNLDNVIGILHVKEVLLHPGQSFKKYLREPKFVPPKKDLYELLKEFRISRTHIAVVVDEYGGVAGVVSLHDLLEEIFGKIEEKTKTEDTLLLSLGDLEYKIQGKMDVWDINTKLGIKLPEAQGRTLSGYLMNQLGRIPQAGDHFKDEWGEYEILEVAHRRIGWVKFRLEESTTGENQKQEIDTEKKD